MFATPVLAISLWDDQAANVYKDKVAREIGDLVTIVIVENSKASQEASTDTSQETSIGAGPGLGIFDFVEAFSLKYDDSNGAEGETTRQGSLSASITAQVIDKQPNGNLVIRGYKSIVVNGENQEIEIVGVIRPEDISSNNTIQSIYVADAEIKYDGEGDVGDKQKPGLVEKLLNWFF